MEREFEKLGRKLENADLSDIMPSFDKQEEWANLQEKLQEADKKRVIPIWFRYAAAAVVGLLLGGVSVNQWLANGDSATQIAIEQAQPVKQQTIIINQPTVSTVETKQPAKEIIATVKKEKKPTTVVNKPELIEEDKELVATKKVEQVKALPETIEPIQEEKVEEIIAEVKSPLRKKAVHFLDIDNEDREVVLSDPESSSSAFQHIMKQVAHTHTMSASSTGQPILLRKMLKK